MVVGVCAMAKKVRERVEEGGEGEGERTQERERKGREVERAFGSES